MNYEEFSKYTINLVSDFPVEYRKKIIKLAFMANNSSKHDCSEIIPRLSVESHIAEEQLYEVLGFYIFLVKLFLSNCDADFFNKLLEIGFTSEFVESLPFFGHRNDIINSLRNNDKNYNRILSIKWRIDISLADSSLFKKIPSSVILTITLKNGKKYAIELDAKMFHNLRFNVALLLKELKSLKMNNMVK